MHKRLWTYILVISAALLCLASNGLAVSSMQQSRLSVPSFEFYLAVPGQEAMWYRNTRISQTHVPAYQGPEDWFSTRNYAYYQPWITNEYILTWEDLAENSQGHQGYSFKEFVVEVNSVIPSPMSEPATMLLFGAGLAGLAGIAMRRKQRRA